MDIYKEIPNLSWKELAELIKNMPEKNLNETVCICVDGSEIYASEMKFHLGHPYLTGF